MYKNQLQELAQRSCFNLPSYTCIRQGPDHAPRFKASVNFNGEIFESPTYCSTLRQAEHSAAQVSLNVLSSSLPSNSLITAKILDETGIYKNLLQETAHRAGLNLPMYTSVRSGSCHFPAFTCNVELAGMSFAGETAKTKKQAEKNAAIAAWSSLKTSTYSQKKYYLPMSSLECIGEEKEQEVVARVLSRFKPKQVRRRRETTTNQWRRRTSQYDTNYNETQKQHRTSLVSLVPVREDKTLRTNLTQEMAKKETEMMMMMMKKSFPLTMADHKAKLNETRERERDSISKYILALSDKKQVQFRGRL
ncbi:unnamed protein product [Cochlearia groenlandica]